MSLSIYCKPCFRGMYAISNSIFKYKKGTLSDLKCERSAFMGAEGERGKQFV